VNVPVKLYPAVVDTRVHAHLIHDTDRQRLQQRMVCPAEDVAVDRDETVKGYEIADNEYVVVHPGELDILQPEASREIEVVEFVDAGRVDPRYLDRTYFLGPDDDEQMYVDLAAGLEKTKLAGMCRWVMRDQSYLGVLASREGLLSLVTHRYAGEIVSAEALEIRRAEPSLREKTIAHRLVEELEEPFQPEQYHDEYEARLQSLVDQKARGRQVALPRAWKPEPTREEDLVKVLEKSLGALKK
jgi:DNA end-binding protein Ku